MDGKLADAMRSAELFSDRYTDGKDCHGVYLPANQAGANGFTVDTSKGISIRQSITSKTALFIVEQWIDYLDDHPDKSFLQICTSEGAFHVNIALEILRKERPDLLARLRILAFCPAQLILTKKSDRERGLQVRNLVKKEDERINACHCDSAHPEIFTIPHTTGDNPHHFLSADYVAAGKPLVFEFMRSGNLY